MLHLPPQLVLVLPLWYQNPGKGKGQQPESTAFSGKRMRHGFTNRKQALLQAENKKG